jgi:hypothetical protein
MFDSYKLALTILLNTCLPVSINVFLKYATLKILIIIKDLCTLLPSIELVELPLALCEHAKFLRFLYHHFKECLPF